MNKVDVEIRLAIDDAMRKNKLEMVSSILDISKMRLIEIMYGDEMSFFEKSMLKAHL